MRVEHDWGEHLDPIHHQRPMPREAQLPGLCVGAQPPRPLARDAGRLPVGRAGPDRDQRLGDPSRDELILPRRVRPLVEVDVPLAQLARILPRLLTRQHLREAMRTITVDRDPLVVLTTMPLGAVLTIEPDPDPACSGLGQTASALLQLLPRDDIALVTERICPTGRLTHLREHSQLKMLSEMREGGASLARTVARGDQWNETHLQAKSVQPGRSIPTAGALREDIDAKRAEHDVKRAQRRAVSADPDPRLDRG